MLRSARSGGIITEINDFGLIADVYDELVAWAPYEQWVSGLEERLARHGLRKGCNIIDIACGTGLSTLPWVMRGYAIVGVDCSAEALAMARQKAERLDRSVRFVRQDLFELPAVQRFDLAVCLVLCEKSFFNGIHTADIRAIVGIKLDIP